MSRAAIQVEKLGKLYRLGRLHEGNLGSRMMNLIGGTGGRDPARGHKAQEEFWALRDVSFELAEGQALGVIGGNGAGKSTLLKVLSRITQPTTGRALVRGRLASLLEVGTGFHPELTGRENVFLNGTILGMRKAEVERKFDEIVAFAGVDKFIDTPVKRYSSGMYVRLAFAVAAHLEPDVLVVDEVLAVGDAAFQQRCLGKMNDVAMNGRTVLFVSHNMSAVRKLCSNALWLVGGCVREYGVADTVLRNYMAATLEGAAKDDSLPAGCLFIEEPDDSQQAQVLRIDLLDEHGEPMREAATWEPARFRITFRTTESFPSFSVELALATPEFATVVLSKSNAASPAQAGVEPGTYHVDCFFDRNLLAAGEYVVGVKLAVPRMERLWFRPDAGRLVVAERDVFSTGFPPRAATSLVAASSEWGRFIPGQWRD